MPIRSVDPTAYSRVASYSSRFAATRPGKWLVRKISRWIDPLMRLTRGQLAKAVASPGILLTHTGAKSGIKRTTPLIYFTDGGRVIVIASNYGSTKNPAWYHNVNANPRVTLSTATFQGEFIGQEVTGAERERLWESAKLFMASYASYERTAGGRRIPVLAFLPVSR